MKYCIILLFIICFRQVTAQEQLMTSISNSSTGDFMPIPQFDSPNLDFSKITEGAKVISIGTSNSFFHKTYLINKEGHAISSGFMPSIYFQPNNNKVVISGFSNRYRDSFNPYGAYDMTSMIILTTFNSFISRIKINRR